MKVLIAAGGTGGHILPALALAKEIKTRNIADVLFVISRRRQDRDIIHAKGVDFKVVSIESLRSKGLIDILKFLGKLFAGAIESAFILLEYRPDTVVGFGGYVSGPIVLLASFSGIKTIIHEQNVYPGKANRILAGFVDRIAISFPETMQYLKGFKSKIVLSGNPLREGLVRDEKEREKAFNIFNVLIIGGSQGAHKLNTIVPDAIKLMQDSQKNILNITHIAGRDDKECVEKSYRAIGVKNRVFSFTEHMARFYNECDFAISRAGAMTVSELLALAIPAILVPYPYAGGHQRHNAMALEKIGSGILLEEKDLTPGIMQDNILRLMDRAVLDAMSLKARNIEKIDADKILIKELYR